MIPLRLCWYWKIWKSKGHTIQGNVSLHLGGGEKEHGLSHVAMYHVTVFLTLTYIKASHTTMFYVDLKSQNNDTSYQC